MLYNQVLKYMIILISAHYFGHKYGFADIYLHIHVYPMHKSYA